MTTGTNISAFNSVNNIRINRFHGQTILAQDEDLITLEPKNVPEFVEDLQRFCDEEVHPSEEAVDDPTAAAMNRFFDCFFKFTHVARDRGVHDTDMRVKLFEIYERRM